MIKVLLADSQPLTATGIRCLLKEMPGVSLIGEALTADKFHECLRTHMPELVIADYHHHGGVSSNDLIQVLLTFSTANTLIVSSDDNRERILELVRSGVKGYVTKTCSTSEITTAIQTVARGEKFFCQRILDIIIEGSVTIAEPEPRKAKSLLSDRELELLKLLAKGYSTHRAAEALFLSPHTIHSHRKNIIRKLNIKSPTQYVLHAMDLGLIKPA